jgi:hypothetical protein
MQSFEDRPSLRDEIEGVVDRMSEQEVRAALVAAWMADADKFPAMPRFRIVQAGPYLWRIIDIAGRIIEQRKSRRAAESALAALP